MVYFILWAVFLLAVILSVPIAGLLEKRKRQAARGPRDEVDSDVGDEQEEVGDEAFAEAEFEDAEAIPAEGEMMAEEVEELR